jgi:hypothetical protein
MDGSHQKREDRMSLSTLDLEALPDRSVVATPAGSIAQLAVSDSPDGPVRLWLVPGHSGAFVSEVVSTWGVTLLRRGAHGIAADVASAEQKAADYHEEIVEAHAERDALAAVIDKVRDALDWRMRADAPGLPIWVQNVRAALAAEPSGPPESMEWSTAGTGYLAAQAIVAWINTHGGEARYVPLGEDTANGWSGYPRIAVRTINGWAYAEPGDTVVMTDEWFAVQTGTSPGWGGARRLRAFRVVSEPSGPEPTTSDNGSEAADLTPDGSADDCDHGGGPATRCSFCEPTTSDEPRCPTECDPDCDADCHEVHQVTYKQQHAPARCPGPAASGTPEATA